MSDNLVRCPPWAIDTPGSTLYREYHDTEWGRELHGRDALFERLCLEAFQSGLSWLTILRKREAFRQAFAGFDVDVVAGFGGADVDRLLGDAGIVRNRRKIDAVIANAPRPCWICPGRTWTRCCGRSRRRDARHGSRRSRRYLPSPTNPSRWPPRELKRRGFRFVGPTTAYALMQATGMVDDHLADCWVQVDA